MKDLKNQRFGRLTVIGDSIDYNNIRYKRWAAGRIQLPILFIRKDGLLCILDLY